MIATSTDANRLVVEHAARLSLEDCELDGVALVAGDTAKPFVRNCRLHGR